MNALIWGPLHWSKCTLNWSMACKHAVSSNARKSLPIFALLALTVSESHHRNVSISQSQHQAWLACLIIDIKFDGTNFRRHLDFVGGKLVWQQMWALTGGTANSVYYLDFFFSFYYVKSLLTELIHRTVSHSIFFSSHFTGSNLCHLGNHKIHFVPSVRGTRKANQITY